VQGDGQVFLFVFVPPMSTVESASPSTKNICPVLAGSRLPKAIEIQNNTSAHPFMSSTLEVDLDLDELAIEDLTPLLEWILGVALWGLDCLFPRQIGGYVK
jgi:hypothetical protein